MIANLRIGDEKTFSALQSYPSGINFAVGTLGCTKYASEEDLFYFQYKLLLTLPSFIFVYGSLNSDTKKLLNILHIKYRIYIPRRDLSFKRRKKVE